MKNSSSFSVVTGDTLSLSLQYKTDIPVDTVISLYVENKEANFNTTFNAVRVNSKQYRFSQSTNTWPLGNYKGRIRYNNSGVITSNQTVLNFKIEDLT